MSEPSITTTSCSETDSKKEIPELGKRTQRKISQANKNVLIRNAAERLSLEKTTRNLDKEKTSKESQLNHAQRLLLQRYGVQKDNDVPSYASARRKMLQTDLDIGRLRSTSWGPSMIASNVDSVEKKFSVCSTRSRDSQRSDIHYPKGEDFLTAPKFTRVQLSKSAPEVNLRSRKVQGNRVKSLGCNFGSVDNITMKRKKFSDVLPPVALPPIHTSVPGGRDATKLKRNKQLLHARLCHALSDPGHKKFETSPTHENRADTDRQWDLSDCRYLRPHVHKNDA